MFPTISTGSRRKLLLPLVALSLFACAAVAQQRAADRGVPDVERLRAHVNYLASDKLEGRRTGTPGAEEAARYVAEEFRRLGLAPGVENSITFQSGPSRIGGGYFQMFPYVAGVELGKSNEMTLTARTADGSPTGTLATLDLRVGEDWMPLGFSASSKVGSASVVFVGYGITDAEQNYDDYKGADVKDHIALALSGTPDDDNPHGRFTRAGELRFKAAAARAAGAKALVIVASEENFKDDKLTTLKYDNAGGDAGLPVVAVSRQAAAKILGVESAATLTKIEQATTLWASKVVEEAGKFYAEHPDSKSQIGYHLLLDPMVSPHHTVVGKDPSYIEVPQNTTLGVTTDIVRKNAPAANVVGVLEGS